MTVLRWIRLRDAGLSALRRGTRAAIVMPILFAVADIVFGNATMAVFAAFGSLAMLLFADFGGPVRDRVFAQGGLVLVTGALVALGTLASRIVWLAAVGMFVVTFLVLFAAIVSSVLASATTALLVGFILPVTLPGPAASIPDRVFGWVLAGVVSMVAVAVLWPTPVRDPLRRTTVRACALLAARLRAESECVLAGHPPALLAAVDDLVTESTAAVAALRDAFFRTPYRPTGLTTSARTLVRLVDEVIWLESILARLAAQEPAEPAGAAVCAVKDAAADLLEHGAALLESVAGPADLDADLARLRAARDAMEQAVTSAVCGSDPTGFVTSLEPSFRAQEMSFAISAIAEYIELTVAARRRTWWQHLLGRRPDGAGSPLATAGQRAGAHIAWWSVTLRNSLRGATALGLAVLAAELIGVQHSFWVVFGTLAVLRSNALSTGQNVVRAILGTVAGIVVGGGLILLIGSNTTVFWLLLPIAVLFTGLAPATISFAAGQAGFTTVLLILFTIMEPDGWELGLVRIEDVGLGCAVSLVVGVVFWPSGAATVFRLALAEAFADGGRYLRGAVAYGVGRCDGAADAAGARPVPEGERRQAAAAARRLDDAFRGFLFERGSKRVPLADVTTVITAVAVLRLTAEAVLDLRSRDVDSTGNRTAVRVALLESGDRVVEWLDRLALSLAGSGPAPGPLTDDDAFGRLLSAVRRDLVDGDRRGTSTAVKVIWTADHIDAVRRQAGLAGPIVAAAAGQRTWLPTK